MRDPKWKEKLHRKLHEDKIPHLDWYFEDAPVAEKLDDIGPPIWDVELTNNSQN